MTKAVVELVETPPSFCHIICGNLCFLSPLNLREHSQVKDLIALSPHLAQAPPNFPYKRITSRTIVEEIALFRACSTNTQSQYWDSNVD